MKVMIVGATSALAHETAKLFARNGAELFLVGRTPEKLEVVASDLKVRGAQRVETYLLDLNDLARHQELLDQALTTLGRRASDPNWRSVAFRPAAFVGE